MNSITEKAIAQIHTAKVGIAEIIAEQDRMETLAFVIVQRLKEDAPHLDALPLLEILQELLGNVRTHYALQKACDALASAYPAEVVE